MQHFFSENCFPGGKGKMVRKRAEWGKGKTKSNAGKREKAELQIRNRSPGQQSLTAAYIVIDLYVDRCAVVQIGGYAVVKADRSGSF